jgi:hypothetical protein
MEQPRPRDIDYAASAVRSALEEKFGRKTSLTDLEVTAGDRTILVVDGSHEIEGTRDQLLAAIRKAEDYSDIWQLLPSNVTPSRPA